MAEAIAPRKRLKEINAEIAAARDKIAALKIEREKLRDAAKASKASDKPA